MVASAIIKEETLKQRAVKLQLRILTTKTIVSISQNRKYQQKSTATHRVLLINSQELCH